MSGITPPAIMKIDKGIVLTNVAYIIRALLITLLDIRFVAREVIHPGAAPDSAVPRGTVICI